MDFIAKPFGWLLLTLYNITNSYGIAVFLFALLVRLILLYFSMKSKKGMMRQTRFAPYLKELEKKYEGNKQKYQEEMQKLYKEEHISPAGGCLWTLIQFPILLALYRAIRFPITIMMGVPAEAYKSIQELLTKMGYVAPTGGQSAAYGQIFESQFISSHFSQFADISERLQKISYSFLGLDLGSQPTWKVWTFFSNGQPVWPQLGLFLIPVISAVVGYVASKISMTSNGGTLAPEAASTNKTMMLMSPLISLWIGFAMPGALGLYWIASSVFAAIQDFILGKIFSKQLDAEDEERRARIKAREEELERKRLETIKLREEGATTVNPNTSKRKIQKTEKLKAEQKAAEWQAVHKPASGVKEETNPSQVGDRPYARGRAYDPYRFAKSADISAEALSAAENEYEADEESRIIDVDSEDTAKTPIIPDIDIRENASENNRDSYLE
jgi:YidC/Oxa1 family membrane protein insertase